MPTKRGPVYYVDIRWRGYPRLKLSTDTRHKSRALAMERTLHALRSAGRRDLLDLLATRRLSLPELHNAYQRNPSTLDQLQARGASPALGPLVDRWLAWLRSPAGVSTRTGRRYAPRTVERYGVSWAGFFSVLPRGRESTVADLTDGFIADYRRSRVRYAGQRDPKGKGLSGATVNRDLIALSSFLTWTTYVEGVPVTRPRIRKERESQGRMRWLSAAELRAFETQCPVEWWPFFAVLFYTGARLGEVQGLRGADVLLHARLITIHEQERRLKSSHSVRELPISPPLEDALASHLCRTDVGPGDLAFPVCQKYTAVCRVWRQTCRVARITEARIHDARHTFGVHAAQAGVPIVRLQKLMGHATPHMTLRYMAHAPESYRHEDAAAIARQMTGTDAETEARAEAARSQVKAS